MKKLTSLISGGIALLVLVLSLSPVSAELNFNDASFASTWNRVDKPVQTLPGIGRGYTWGFAVPGSENITTEPYNGATRKVQYFDKARMEVNNPNANPNDLFYVTTGLLVKELVSGQRQDANNTFATLRPAQVQIAGDPNLDGATNQVAPTYASFKGVATLAGAENGVSSNLGAAINSRIDKAGTVSAVSPPEPRTLKGYDPVTRHNLADVFVDFAGQTGPIWNGNAYEPGSIFFNNPTYVLGRPITEPYWVRAVVGGVEKDVLVQLFEHRVLTYTPANPDGFKVEMGNVGQHYFWWRYILNRVKTAPPTYPSIRFAVVGDFGADSPAEGDVAKLITGWNPDFVITVGDNNYPLGSASTIDTNIGKYYHGFIYPYVGKYGNGAASANRFFPVPGNHDWSNGNLQPYLDYFTLPGNERYYDFAWGPVHFFALDSDPHEPDGITANSTQAVWLQSKMSNATEPWKLVYMHHPPFSSAQHGSTPALQWPYKAWGVSAVLAGHDHTYERIVKDDFPYFVNGLGGYSIYQFTKPVTGSTLRFNQDYGAMLVEADASQITFKFITRGGGLIDNYTLNSTAVNSEATLVASP